MRRDAARTRLSGAGQVGSRAWAKVSGRGTAREAAQGHSQLFVGKEESERNDSVGFRNRMPDLHGTARMNERLSAYASTSGPHEHS